MGLQYAAESLRQICIQTIDKLVDVEGRHTATVHLFLKTLNLGGHALFKFPKTASFLISRRIIEILVLLTQVRECFISHFVITFFNKKFILTTSITHAAQIQVPQSLPHNLLFVNIRLPTSHDLTKIKIISGQVAKHANFLKYF